MPACSFAAPSASSRSSTEARNAFTSNAPGAPPAAAPFSFAAASASTAKSARTPTASMVASRAFHQCGFPWARAASDSASLRRAADDSASSAAPSKRSHSSFRSIPHTARAVDTSSSSSATYWLGSSRQASSCAAVMHMYPIAWYTVSSSAFASVALKRGCSTRVMISSTICDVTVSSDSVSPSESRTVSSPPSAASTKPARYAGAIAWNSAAARPSGKSSASPAVFEKYCVTCVRQRSVSRTKPHRAASRKPGGRAGSTMRAKASIQPGSRGAIRSRTALCLAPLIMPNVTSTPCITASARRLTPSEAAGASTRARSSGNKTGTVSATCVSSKSPAIIARHRSAPLTASSLARSRIAPMSKPVNAGHACGQSHVHTVAMAMPQAVRILPIGSLRPTGRSSRMAAFSSSEVCGGKKRPSPSCQCSLMYFFSTTAASCRVPYGVCWFRATLVSASPNPSWVPPCVSCVSAFTRVVSSALMDATSACAI